MTAPVVLVTGATDGIGRETARQLAARGARVIVHGRDQTRLDRVAAEVKAHAALRADLASLAEVRGLADALRPLRPTVLLHNAGIFAKKKQTSADGFELTFAVNHLAGLALTHHVLASDAAVERVIFVSSGAHGSGDIALDDPQGLKKRWSGLQAYCDSKLANVLTAVELARRLREREIAVTSLHPGVVGTKLLRDGWGGGGSDTLEESAATSVMLAHDDEGVTGTGRYFAYGRPARAHKLASDAAYTARFYEISCALAGVDPVPPGK